MRNSFLVLLIAMTVFTSCQTTNRLGSRIFYANPELYYSKSKYENQGDAIKKYVIKVIDNRGSTNKDFIGEKNEITDFYKTNLESVIIKKINVDEKIENDGSSSNLLEISVKTFYVRVSGFLWLNCKGVAEFDVWISNGNEKIEKVNKTEYKTDGTDKEYEGKLVDTIEGMANITLGITLRKAIDSIYFDIFN